MMRQPKENYRFQRLSGQSGFTLLELVIAMVIGGLVMAGIVATYVVQQRNYRMQTLVMNTQQNLRGAFYRLQNELMMIGYDRSDSARFGLVNIADINDNSSITFTGDFGPTGGADNGTIDAGETISFFLYNSPDTPGNGVFDLARRVDGGAATLLAEGIEAMVFAYAFDDNPRDGRIDFVNIGGVDDDFGFPIKDKDEHFIWAIDTDADNVLDTTLDTNQDGLIDGSDAAGGAPLPSNVEMDRVRGIKIWLLARTRSTVLGSEKPQTFRLGHRLITRDDAFKRRVLTATIIFRNLGT